MWLIIISIVFFCLVGFWLFKDRQYLKKDTQDVIGEEMKKILNIPTPSDKFPKIFHGPTKKKRASQNILEGMNKREGNKERDK